MTPGFYTKHYLEDGRSFYFNAEKNISTWTVPLECTVHEAIGVKNHPVDQIIISASVPDVGNNNVSQSPREDGEATEDQQILAGGDVVAVANITVITENGIQSNAILTASETGERSQKHKLPVEEEPSTLDDLLSSMREKAAANTAKRFKSNSAAKEKSADQGSSSEYLKLVSAYTPSTGSDELGGKWLVR